MCAVTTSDCSPLLFGGGVMQLLDAANLRAEDTSASEARSAREFDASSVEFRQAVEAEKKETGGSSTRFQSGVADFSSSGD